MKFVGYAFIAYGLYSGDRNVIAVGIGILFAELLADLGEALRSIATSLRQLQIMAHLSRRGR